MSWTVNEVGEGWMPTESQVIAAAQGFMSVAKTNPPTETSDGYRLWLVMDGDKPVGTLCVCGVYGDGIAEIGVNFWASPSPNQYRAMDVWGQRDLVAYNGLMCRVYEWNEAIKKAVMRFGFHILGSEGDVEVWGAKTPDITWLRR